MKKSIDMTEFLKIIREFQERYEGSHIGGPLGIFLHGINLKRDLGKSDLDMTIAHFANDIEFPNMEESSDRSDFDKCVRINLNESYYIKMDMKYNPSAKYDSIHYDGYLYRVSKLEDICEWKKKYANMGVQKHIDDLIVINGGERPVPKVETFADFNPWEGDLPF